MLKILESQMTELAAQRQGEFVAQMRPLLRSRYPEPTASMTEEELAGVVRRGMSAARSYGIQTAADVSRYIDLMFQLGFDFDRSVDWAAEILNRPDFTGQVRIDLLCAVHEGRIPDSPDEGPFFP